MALPWGTHPARHAGFEPDDDDVEDAVVGADGTARLRMPRPGDYELSWFDTRTEHPELQAVHVPSPSSPPIVEAEPTRGEVAGAVLAAGG